jgi:hypothetical protein
MVGHVSSGCAVWLRNYSDAAFLLGFEQRVSIAPKRFSALDFGFGARDFTLCVGDILFQFLDRQGFDIYLLESGLYALKCGFKIIIQAHFAPPGFAMWLVFARKVSRA